MGGDGPGSGGAAVGTLGIVLPHCSAIKTAGIPPAAGSRRYVERRALARKRRAPLRVIHVSRPTTYSFGIVALTAILLDYHVITYHYSATVVQSGSIRSMSEAGGGGRILDSRAVRKLFPYLEEVTYLNTATTGLSWLGQGAAAARFYDQHKSRGYSAHLQWRGELERGNCSRGCCEFLRKKSLLCRALPRR